MGQLVGRTPDDAVASTPLGGIRLIDYLPTRAFELTVHGIDLARATRQQIPDELLEATRPGLMLCATIAGADQRLEALLALTGRQSLPTGFTVL